MVGTARRWERRDEGLVFEADRVMVRSIVKVLLLLLALGLSGFAQTPTPGESPREATSSEPTPSPTLVEPPLSDLDSEPEPVPVEFATPESVYQNFMASMALASPLRPNQYLKASRFLDLSRLSGVGRSERGIKLSQQLYEILQSSSSDIEKRDLRSGENPFVLYRQPNGDSVRLRRGEDGRWLFDSDTVQAIPSMHEVLSAKGKIKTWYLESLNFELLGINANLWLVLALLPLVSYLLGSLVVMLCAIPIRVKLLKDFWLPEERLKPLLRPVGWLVASIFAWLILSLLDLPANFLLTMLVVVKVVATFAVVVGGFRLSDEASNYASRLSAATESKLDNMLIPLARRSAKVLLAVIALLFLAQNLNIEVWSLFAGFSIFGAMVALAGQDMVKNFFGSITILTDQTFAVGDLITVSGIEGVVEDVGFRSTRIRTAHDSLVTLPNSLLLTASVDNYGRRNYRRYNTQLLVRWDTPPETLEAFCEGIREIIRQHPYTRKDSFQVWVNDVGEYALKILLNVFWSVPDWSTELQEKHRLLVDLHRLAGDLEVEFAYPSQQILLSRRKDQFVSDFNTEQQHQARAKGKTAAANLVNTSLDKPETERDVF